MKSPWRFVARGSEQSRFFFFSHGGELSFIHPAERMKGAEEKLPRCLRTNTLRIYQD